MLLGVPSGVLPALATPPPWERCLGCRCVEGAAHINDNAALAAHLHWRRRRTGDARRPRLSQQLAPAPTALVSDPRHLSHAPTLCLTNTDISSVPYKTPWNFYREGMILPVFGFVYPEVRE